MTLQCVIHYQHLKTRSKIIPLNQYKFQTLNQNREARPKLRGENIHEQQSKYIPPYFDSSKHDAHTKCYKKFTMVLNIAKRKFEVEGTSMCNNFQSSLREDQGKVQNNYFQNTVWFVNIVEQSKSNTRSSSHVC